jgi:uncharacterized protein
MNRIIYLHGFASSPASGKARFFADRLRAAGARVDIPALDAGDFEHLTISGQLRLLDQVADGDAVSLIGSSMGGYLAALYAARHPEVSRLVLLAPAFCFAQRWQERMGADAVADWRTSGSVKVFHYGDNCEHSLSPALLDDGLAYEDYPDFRQPALIFHGKHDDVVPADYSANFAESHANAHLEILDSGHDLHNVLDYMAPKVEEFLMAP